MQRNLTYLTAIIATTTLTACTTLANFIDSSDTDMEHSTEILQAYHWNLVNTISSDGHTSSAWVSNDSAFNQPLILSFSEDRVAIQNLCNPLMASYAITERQIDFSQVVSGMRMCADQQLMQYEQQVGQLLPTATDWSLAIADPNQNEVTSPTLTLHFKNGDSWLLQGELTSETKYGAPAETIFLEVAPHTEPCSESGESCLKVRQVSYDDNGIKTHVGEWAFLQLNAIIGFTHQAGLMNVLRINRFPIKNAPTDTAQYAYELDMVVETRRDK